MAKTESKAAWDAAHSNSRVPFNNDSIDASSTYYGLFDIGDAWKDGNINKAVKATASLNGISTTDCNGKCTIPLLATKLKKELLYGKNGTSKNTTPIDTLSYRGYPTPTVTIGTTPKSYRAMEFGKFSPYNILDSGQTLAYSFPLLVGAAEGTSTTLKWYNIQPDGGESSKVYGAGGGSVTNFTGSKLPAVSTSSVYKSMQVIEIEATINYKLPYDLQIKAIFTESANQYVIPFTIPRGGTRASYFVAIASTTAIGSAGSNYTISEKTVRYTIGTYNIVTPTGYTMKNQAPSYGNIGNGFSATEIKIPAKTIKITSDDIDDGGISTSYNETSYYFIDLDTTEINDLTSSNPSLCAPNAADGIQVRRTTTPIRVWTKVGDSYLGDGGKMYSVNGTTITVIGSTDTVGNRNWLARMQYDNKQFKLEETFKVAADKTTSDKKRIDQVGKCCDGTTNCWL